jgi:hypothetical protein
MTEIRAQTAMRFMVPRQADQVPLAVSATCQPGVRPVSIFLALRLVRVI